MSWHLNQRIRSLEAQLAQERERVEALESLRPQWALGFTNDSMAAQAWMCAVSSLWSMLGVHNQTDAVQRLRQLLENENAGTKT